MFYLDADPQLTDRENKGESSQTKTADVIVLDTDILEKMGEDPSSVSQEDHVLNSELTRRWNNWLVKGLHKDEKEKILKKYSRKGPCALEAPIVNREIVKAIPEATLKRDEYFVQTQNSVGTALSALGAGISMLLKAEDEEEIEKLELLEKLFDTGKILTEIFYAQSKARKAYISPSLTSIKPILDKATTDECLYGSKLGESIKDEKALEKFSQTIKPQKGQQRDYSGNKYSPLAAQRQVGQIQKFKTNTNIRFKQPFKQHWKSNQNRPPYPSTSYQSASYQNAPRQSAPHNRPYNAKK